MTCGQSVIAPLAMRFAQGGDDVHDRAARPGCAGLLGAIQDRDARTVFGKRGDEMLRPQNGRNSRTFSRPTFSPCCNRAFDGFLRGFGAGAHHHDDALGIGGADIVEQVILRPVTLGEPVHRVLHDGRARAVEGIAGFARLEEDVGILGRAAKHRAVGRQRALAMLRGPDSSSIMARRSSSSELLDLGHFVRGAEAVEEVQERNARFERGGLGDQRPSPYFLDGVGAQHRQAGCAAAITSL